MTPLEEKPIQRTVLALSSSGGHWVQLMRLRPAFADARVTFACTDASVRGQVANHAFHVFPDANKSEPLRLIWSALVLTVILLRVRPDVIVTTGAAGGSLAIGIGRLMGARGLFVDSIANARTLSVSARLSLRVANAVFTQWPRVASGTPARFHGNVL